MKQKKVLSVDSYPFATIGMRKKETHGDFHHVSDDLTLAEAADLLNRKLAQMSTRPCVERRVAGFASVEDPQHVGYEEDQQYGAQPHARTPTITPAAMAVVPSTAP